MIIRKLRLQRGWSQEQLATLSGLSIRTIQRIERGQSPSLESLKSLAAVFETDVADLKEEPNDMNHETISHQEQRVIEQVRAIKDFYSHLITYVLVNAVLFGINIFTSPEYIWAWWPALGWGIGLLSHWASAFEVFDLFGAQWEKRQIEKRLGRKL
ncbi:MULTISPECIES: helix-turn-helix domain-containing protein [unclassified Pseudoalteromonas]|uniref:helix-turn-helix domain-containing protein n=1 Tax=unclassified Pseudoalteromonas TaxID=194690 RepID=UPI0020980036|nr:helix-turn-helix domain-containing protein [Pseudoalteromonas sp. XMcav2-N]MCO7189593.1 helix-turn-helix domain-containing protein [Pseudoalteromonas sp. XMcav2-N]